MMDRYLFEYLRNIGFKDDEINSIEDNNPLIVYVNVQHAKQIIVFLKELGLDIINIRKVLTSNVFLISENFKNLNILNEIYINQLNFNKSQLLKLIISNPELYSANPNDIIFIINYLEDRKYDKEYIRNLIIDNPKIISMDLSEFEKEIILK